MGQIIATLGIIATLRPSSSTNSENTKKRKRDDSSCSEEDERIISSSLPSSSTARWKHDVFLSFRGEDTRSSFTDHLYSYLKGKGILVFRDDESLKRGKCISQELPQAIQESRYAIVIFSANYASSKWCLRELAEIVEWEEKKNLTIIPIFYHVNPSDVRNQRGNFAEAFAAHEKDLKVDIREIDSWRNACRKVGNISGEHINGDRYESTIIQQISGMIFYNYTMLNILIHDNQKFVGINSRVEEMMNLLHMESNDVRFVGIHGMGGVGKTTLAKIIYDRVSCLFEGSSFISCIRERSTTAHDLASLQKELLSTIMQEKIRIYNHHQGIGMIMKMLQNKRVFIALDDVDRDEQLTTLVGDWKWFGPGSRVIITCRDSHLLKRNKVNGICEVQLLQTADALQLFSLSAFDKTNPPKNYKDLSMNFVSYARGLPLALKVLGRFLFGRTIDLWKSARDKLEAIPKTEIFDILKISFDGLEESQQNLFLDLACFFHQRSLPSVYYFKEIYLAIDFEVLVDKSLLSKSDYDEGYLIMHHLLEEMGQEIVHRQCPDEPGRRSRLFRAEDVIHVLKNDTGTDAIESIVLGFCPTKEKLNAKAFSKMRKLRLLHFKNYGSITWHGNPLKYIPSDKLRFLHWVQCPSKSWPSSFQSKNLNVLSMSFTRIERLWKGLMVLPNLKYLNLSYSENLIETPDLTGAPNLEKIDFSTCTSLSKVHPSIKELKRLQNLKMYCTPIKQLWKGLAVLHNLNYLNLKDSENLIETPNLSGAPNLEEIQLEGCTNLCKIHPSIGFLKRLKRLSLDGCSRLMNFQNILEDMTSLESLSMNFPIFPSVIYSFSSLESLRLDGCSRLEKFPDLSRLECLKEFKAYGTAITQIPSINLIPKSIHSLDLEGRKRIPRESRDLVMFINDYSLPKQSSYPTNHDIGSPVEYEMEEMLEVEALGISLCSPYFGNTVMIEGWSLGSRIPEWVHNKSNGSSLQIELDGNTMSVIGCAIFIVCDCHQFHSPEATSIPRLFKETSNVVFSFCFERDDGSLEELFHPNWSAEVSLVKPGVYWAYTRSYGFPECLKSRSSDKQSFMIKISVRVISYQTPELEVKEWGVHLVCPDDTALGLGSDLDSYGQFYSAWKCGMTRNED